MGRYGIYSTEYIHDEWNEGDILYVNGTLRWDNGTGIEGMNITIQVINGTGYTVNISYDTTNAAGEFYIEVGVGDWDINTKIYFYFDSKDPSNFGVPEGYYVEEIIGEQINGTPAPP